MLMIRNLLGFILLWIGLTAFSQVVTTSPAIVQTNSKNVVITFHADRGTKGLAGLSPSVPVYAHTGVITSTSKSDSDWQYAPVWGDNTSKYEMKYVAADTYTLTIPSINEFYGITSADVTVKKLAFVFRNSDGSREGKGENGGDIFVDVLPTGLQMTFTDNAGATAVKKGTEVDFTVNVTELSDIEMTVEGETAPFAMVKGAVTLTGKKKFEKPGIFTVVAKVVSGGDTMTKSLTVTVVDEAEMREYPGGVPVMGAVRQPDGKVRFCIAAPKKESAMIVGSWNGYNPDPKYNMFYHDYQGQRYFWIDVDGLTPATDYFYYYLIDSSRKVGDPYARLILDPYNDKYIPASVFPDLPPYPSDKVRDVPLAVYNSASDDYDWEVTDFKGVEPSQLIIYELLIRDFTGAEGKADGSGTIQGVLQHLDYIKALGVNAVSLLPIMEFDGNNSWGYNPNFYFATDKAYGTPSDYRLLIDEIHKRGMAVILDIVFNQTAGLHPWYQMYDIASNPFYNGSAPHAYSVLNDWNQDNPLVQKQWDDVLKYWITAFKVDGFRFDLVKGLGDNDSYGNTYNPATNTFGTPSEEKTNEYNQSRVDRMKRLHSVIREVKPDAYFINENLAGAREENAMAEDGELNWANVNHAARIFADYTDGKADLNRFYAPDDDNRLWGSTVSYAESHDEERLAYDQQKSAPASVRGNHAVAMRRLGCVGAQMLMAPGAHLIWMFQELGADETTKNSDGSNNTSPKKVIWSYLDDPDRHGLMESYSRLCAIRAKNPQMFDKGVTTVMKCDESQKNRPRYIKLTKGDSELICVVNSVVSGNMSVAVPMSHPASDYQILSASYQVTPVIEDGKVTLPGSSYAVIATKELSSAPGIEVDKRPYRIVAENQTITVEGEYKTASVSSVSGMTLPLGSRLPAGIYIVTVDGESLKVVL